MHTCVTVRLSNPQRLSEINPYDRCKANRRCNWGVVSLNQSSNDAGNTIHTYIHTYIIRDVYNTYIQFITTNCSTMAIFFRLIYFWTSKIGDLVPEDSVGMVTHIHTYVHTYICIIEHTCITIFHKHFDIHKCIQRFIHTYLLTYLLKFIHSDS